MEKKNLLAVLALMLALLILVFAAKHAGQSEEDPNLTITALSVGKADAGRTYGTDRYRRKR